MIFGTTYSHRHAKYLGLNNNAFKELLSFKFNVIRLGCYWDEIENIENTFDFSKIRLLLDQCETANQDIVLTVGMKAPRWPEFYIPKWLEGKKIDEIQPYVLRFIERSLTELKQYSCIKYWQVENEPLDPSGPQKLKLSTSLLEKEIALARSLDTRPVIVTAWGNELKQRGIFSDVEKNADIIGLDLYYKVPVIKNIFWGPRSYPSYINNCITQTKKQVWIMELQAEPWEKGNIFDGNFKPKTINEELLRSNFQSACKLNPSAILFWGYEYWYFKKMQGNIMLWDTIKNIISKS